MTKEESQSQAVSVESEQLARPGRQEEDNWIEVRGGIGASETNKSEGLSVLPLWQNSVASNTSRALATGTELNLDDANALLKAEKMAQLDEDSKNKMVPSGHTPVLVGGTRNRVILEGMRSGDDGQDDVFIVELERGNSGLGLGLIDGLVSLCILYDTPF